MSQSHGWTEENDEYASDFLSDDEATCPRFYSDWPGVNPDIETSMQSLAIDQTLLVAAIDIGTTYSGIAFSFAHEQTGAEANPDLIHVNTWENQGGSRAYFKTPSSLLLHPNGNLHSFGDKAIHTYNSLTEDNMHHDWYFFHQFKMTLHQEEEIRGDSVIMDENGKKMEAIKVFGYSIQYLKEYLMKLIDKSHARFRESDIRWVITVPAIWKDSAKKFMRQAAEQAGIDKDRIEIALEPESASLYCRMIESKQSGLKFPPGTRYMVLDCGGGTVDVTIHEVIKGNKLKELHAATGGAWGGKNVDKNFLEFISQLAGPEEFNNYSSEHKTDYLQLLEDFEMKKRMADPVSTGNVTVRIPASLSMLLISNKQNFERTEGVVGLVGDKLRIQAGRFISFFLGAVTEIINHVKELLKVIPNRLDYIFLVGGFVESPVLQKAIKDNYSNRSTIIIPIDPSLCVLKGAVLYGFRPSTVAFRMCRYTYGVATSMRFIKGEHPPERRSLTRGGEAVCDDIFDKHVEKDQEIPTNVVLREKIYYPWTATDKLLHISLYRSSKWDPKFVDETDCHWVGTFEIKVDKSVGKTARDRPIKVKLIFGATDIKMLAEQKNGRAKEADFKLNGMF